MLGALALMALPVFAFASGDVGQIEKQATNWTAIIMFGAFVVATLFITKWGINLPYGCKNGSIFATVGQVNAPLSNKQGCYDKCAKHNDGSPICCLLFNLPHIPRCKCKDW